MPHVVTFRIETIERAARRRRAKVAAAILAALIAWNLPSPARAYLQTFHATSTVITPQHATTIDDLASTMTLDGLVDLSATPRP